MNLTVLITIVMIAAMAAFFTAVAQDAKTPPKTGAVTESVDRKYKNVGPETFDKLRQSKTNIVIDVRTREEYEKGHLPDSVLIDIADKDFDAKIAKLDKSKTYLVHCAGGGRGGRACKKMEQLGFTNLFNLEGGLTAWQKAGKAVEK
jgi:phage shock protein E